MPLFAHGEGSYPASDLVMPSAARTTAPTPVIFGTTGASGLIVVVSTTAITLTPGITLKINGVLYPTGDTPGATPVKWTILTGTQITAAGVVQEHSVHPALTVVAGRAASALLPDKVEISVEHLDADSITYSVMAILVP